MPCPDFSVTSHWILTEQKTTQRIRLFEELRRDLPMIKDRHDPDASPLQASMRLGQNSIGGPCHVSSRGRARASA